MRILLAIVLLFLTLPALAQDTPEEERSFFLSFIEDQLSTPNRQIRISGIQGVLSSNATIGQITIADREGIWLRITNASIIWSRTALLLRQRLEVERLAADSIEVLRKPLPEEGLPPPESSSFQIPELPIAIDLARLEVPSVSFGADVFGLESELSVEGRLRLEGGTLDTELAIRRLDGPGGQFALAAQYANDTRILDLDLSLQEPANGIVANLLSIEGRPPLSLTLAGSGPLDQLDITLALDAEGQRVLDGTANLRRQSEGIGFQTELSGPIARLIPERFRDFFGAETMLTANGVAKDAGGFTLESLNLDSAALHLEAAADTGADGFLQRLALNAAVEDSTGDTVLLPVPGGETTVQRAALTLDFGGAGSEEWDGRLDISQLTTGDFAAESVAIDLGGVAENLNLPDQRRISFNAEGGISGIIAEQADIAEALGNEIRLDVAGDWRAEQPVALERAELSGNGLSVSLAGEIAELAFNGDIGVRASSIVPFSGLAGRDLSGGLDLKANGTVEPVTGAFDLTLDGSATELRIGNDAADNLLNGTTRLTGRVARGEQGLRTENFRVANDQLQLTADGVFASGAADFDLDFALEDLALVSDSASGRLTATGRAAGSDGRINLTFGADVPSGSLIGKRLTEAGIDFEGVLQDSALTGAVTGSAFLDGVRADLATDIAVRDGERRLSNLDFSAGGARATGGVVQNRDGLLEGNLTVEAADISTAAALFLAEASGSINADIQLAHADGRQNAEASGDVRNLRVETNSIGSADFQAAIEDLFGVPLVNGTIDARDLSAGGIDVATLRADATRSGETTEFSANATLDNGAALSTSGSLSPQDGGFDLTLNEAELSQAELNARLLEPAAIRLRGENVSFDTITIDAGGGQIAARGEVAREIDVALQIRDLPLAIANSIRPDLELGGTVNGTATVTGPRDTPSIDFDIAGRQLRAAALAQAGLSSLTIDATGTTTAERLTVDARVTSPEGLNAAARGAVPIGGEGSMSLNIDLNAFPLAVANAVAPGQDLGGQISGTARVTGTLTSPEASFDLRGDGLTAAPLAEFGAAPLQLSANGRFADETVTLSALRTTGPQGLTVSASGRLPVSGTGLALDVDGTIPLALANNMLAERGATVTGTLNVDANISGSLSQPAINGNFSTSNAQAIDPESNVRLNPIQVSGTIQGETISINSATATLASGGSISIGGTISTNAVANFPADLNIRLNEASYTDGEMVAATVSGAMSLTGPLTRDPLLSGDLTLSRAEITVPENLGGSGAAGINVKHINPPPAVQRTLERAKADDGTPMPSSRPSVLRLNVRVNAPARIFVRGRGLDAELGGSVELAGSVNNIQPVGGFEMIRGRLSILGKRITFDEGTVTLVGDLDPFLDFVARSEGDITVFITVRGRVSDLDIAFSSQPELPQDEVLARLIFNRGIQDLSPMQIARLAAAAAELAGGSNNSLLGQLRGAAGLDDLDIVSDEEGNTAVRAGRYIQDNIYLGVEAGSQGTTRGTINLDITESLKARGAVGSDGDSSLGIFYERDY